MTKSILFNTEMVQAILGGRKTQERRAVKLPRYADNPILRDEDGYLTAEHIFSNERIRVNSQYQIGDILWVRETWVQLFDLDGNDQIIEGTDKYYYAADNPDFPYTHFVRDDGIHKDTPAWRPSIHMPKEAARLFLRVTDVRAERLQDISEQDAKAESFKATGGCRSIKHSARINFFEYWDTLYTRRGHGCTNNPWVWVYTFERCDKPQNWIGEST